MFWKIVKLGFWPGDMKQWRRLRSLTPATWKNLNFSNFSVPLECGFDRTSYHHFWMMVYKFTSCFVPFHVEVWNALKSFNFFKNGRRELRPKKTMIFSKSISVTRGIDPKSFELLNNWPHSSGSFTLGWCSGAPHFLDVNKSRMPFSRRLMIWIYISSFMLTSKNDQGITRVTTMRQWYPSLRRLVTCSCVDVSQGQTN